MKVTLFLWPASLGLLLVLQNTVTEAQYEILEDPRTIATTIQLGLGLVEYLYDLGQKIFHNSNITLDIDLGRNMEKDILHKINYIYAELDRQATQLNNLQEALQRVRTLPKLIRWENRLDQLSQHMRPILALDRTFAAYQKRRDKINPWTLEAFANQVVGAESSSVPQLLDYIHDLVIPFQPAITGPGLFEMMDDIFTEDNDQLICTLQQSPHQLLHSLYNLIAVTEIKGYTMMHFAWMVLQLHNKGNFSTEATLARQALLERTEQKTAAARRVLADLSTAYWRCDPSRHKEGDTFLQLTELLQGYIENEVDMNPEKSCKQDCSAYTFAKIEGCFHNLFCSKQPRCRGNIINCRFYKADSTVCMSTDRHRRYDWIEYKNGKTLGQKGSCANKMTVDSWWRWLFWHCSYCFCVCDENGPNSDRFFSLQPVLADPGQVVTGLRFVKYSRVIHLQIQQGVPLPFGAVNASTVKWKEIKPISIHNPSLVEDQDFMAMAWNKRGVDLDDLVVPVSQVVTGVRFRQLGGNLNLEVQSKGIEFATAKMKLTGSWISNDNTPAAIHKPRTKLNLGDADVPIKAGHSQPNGKTGQFLEFTHSSIEKDVAQTTIPFLDSQPVAVNPSTWLQGIGIFHKSQQGYGGFITLKVLTLNMSNHLETTAIADIPEFSRLLEHMSDSTTTTTTNPTKTEPPAPPTVKVEDERMNEIRVFNA